MRRASPSFGRVGKLYTLSSLLSEPFLDDEELISREDNHEATDEAASCRLLN